MRKPQLLTSGTLCSSKVYYYKTLDAKAVFTFSYEYELGYYDIIIHDHPSYNGRDETSSVAHWLPCDLSPLGKKICFFEGKEPKTLEIAKKFSMHYAELTWTYIKTGITIDQQLISRN